MARHVRDPPEGQGGTMAVATTGLHATRFWRALRFAWDVLVLTIALAALQWLVGLLVMILGGLGVAAGVDWLLGVADLGGRLGIAWLGHAPLWALPVATAVRATGRPRWLLRCARLGTTNGREDAARMDRHSHRPRVPTIRRAAGNLLVIAGVLGLLLGSFAGPLGMGVSGMAILAGAWLLCARQRPAPAETCSEDQTPGV
jgi:hypothetical protein